MGTTKGHGKSSVNWGKDLLAAIAFVVCFSAMAWAQGTASIVGNLRDTSGAIIPDGKVTVKNVESGLVRTVQTDSSGNYSVLTIPVGEYEDHFLEEHVKHSNALHSVLKQQGPYFVGPMARYNLNFDQLSPLSQESARDAGLTPVCRNPFKSIIIRSVEILYACDEALRILSQYEPPEKAAIRAPVRSAAGCACTEAPRGILYHRYRIDDQGTILEAKIVPPTSQNLRVIEQDLSQFVPKFLTLPEPELGWRCEQAVRNYDPCISCATHFLKLHVDRG